MHPIFRVPALLALALSASQCASGEKGEKSIVHENGYIQESPHPDGFPQPGPFNQIVRKSYPAYRAAVTKSERPNSGFWTLFRHIKRQEIAMTSPVEMKMAEDDQGSLEMEEMSFLYRHTEQGSTGKDGEQVEVLDLPAIKVLSYAWQGPRSDKMINHAKALLLAEAQKEQLQSKGFRLLGYNSPFVPDEKKTHELQMVLK